MDSKEFQKESDSLDWRLRRTSSAGISSAEGTPAAADDQTSRYAAVAGHDRISIDAVRGAGNMRVLLRGLADHTVRRSGGVNRSSSSARFTTSVRNPVSPQRLKKLMDDQDQ